MRGSPEREMPSLGAMRLGLAAGEHYSRHVAARACARLQRSPNGAAVPRSVAKRRRRISIYKILWARSGIGNRRKQTQRRSRIFMLVALPVTIPESFRDLPELLCVTDLRGQAPMGGFWEMISMHVFRQNKWIMFRARRL